MYFFCFDKFAGFDRVFLIDTFSNDKKLKEGDLIKIDGSYFLCLGKEISFSELYNYRYSAISYEKVIGGFFLSKTMGLIHYLVNENLTTYKKVIDLFIDSDIDKLIKYFDDKKPKQSYQELIVYPDLWSLTNSIDEKNISKDKTIILHSHTSPKQKLKAYFDIRQGSTEKIITTYFGVFQDWNCLKKISIIDSHKWYYKSQQDPRYRTPDVLKKIAELHEAELLKSGYELY